MSNTIFITANWTTGALSQQTISRQYDNNRYAVQFIGYPEGDGTEELDLYLLVWMSTAPGQKPGEITPMQLNSDQWYISNYFTQQVQVIKFQLCVLNEAGTYEAHSPIFSGRIGDSLEHDGTSHDIDVSTLFDAYREYLNELIIRAGAVAIDPTLSQSGQAADAKKTGDAITSLKEDLADLIKPTLDKGVVKNQYVNNTGKINNYNGWDRTRYICVKEWKKLKVTATSASNYNCFYDANKSFIFTTTQNRTIDIVSGENEVIVPPNAYYAIFSGSAEYMEDLAIEGVEKDHEYQDNKFREYIQTDLYGKQVLLLGINDISVGYKIAEGEVQAANDNVAITNSYYPLANPHNKYHFDCPGYIIYVYEYSKDGSGTYTFIKSTTITSSGTFWASTKTTHIRFYFKTINSNTLIPYAVTDFCDKFTMREQNELNTYLRVCTFNQAANYPSFTSATEEDLNKRVVNYLNFIGEYNPDVLCAQEAVATYFQPVSYEKSTQKVFNRKYFYMYQSGYQRKTWSKYQYTDNAMVTFQSQAEGDSRFYGKQTIHIDGKDIVVINTHCAYQGESDFDAVRKEQFEELVAEMQQHEYCVCCGDFNAWSASEFDVFKNAGFICANCGDYGVIDTWYVGTDYPDWPFKAVDNIIVTPNIAIQNVQRGPYDFTYFSDHAPLIADLQIR